MENENYSQNQPTVNMDINGPRRGSVQQTSRPIITSNKPLTQDPMFAAPARRPNKLVGSEPSVYKEVQIDKAALDAVREVAEPDIQVKYYEPHQFAEPEVQDSDTVISSEANDLEENYANSIVPNIPLIVLPAVLLLILFVVIIIGSR